MVLVELIHTFLEDAMGRRKGSKDWTEDRAKKVLLNMHKWYNLDKTHLFLQDYCAEYNISNHRISEWYKKWQWARDIIDVCKTIQESRLISGAVINKYNAKFVQFFLNTHSPEYITQTKQEVSGGYTTPLQVVFKEVTKETVNKLSIVEGEQKVA